MRGSRNFRQGGGGGGGGVQVNLTKKADIFFLSSAYSSEVKWLISKKTIIFQGSRGSNFFQGGGGGGVQLLIPYRNPYNLWFSRGGPDPLSPLWIRTCIITILVTFLQLKKQLLLILKKSLLTEFEKKKKENKDSQKGNDFLG